MENRVKFARTEDPAVHKGIKVARGKIYKNGYGFKHKDIVKKLGPMSLRPTRVGANISLSHGFISFGVP